MFVCGVDAVRIKLCLGLGVTFFVLVSSKV